MRARRNRASAVFTSLGSPRYIDGPGWFRVATCEDLGRLVMIGGRVGILFVFLYIFLLLGGKVWLGGHFSLFYFIYFFKEVFLNI